MLKVAKIIDWIEALAPFRYAASWDNCGLQVGDPDAAVARILVALDPSSGTIEEARKRECQCMVTHHPLVFRPLADIRTDKFPGNLVIKAISYGIHLIVAHTNLDAALQGTNGWLLELLSLERSSPLESNLSFVSERTYGGMGRVGFLEQPVVLSDFVESVKEALGVFPRVVGRPAKPVHCVAVCTGSGGSLLELAISAGADAYVTGDLKYHEAQRALEADVALIDVGHFASERLIVQPLADYLQACASGEGVEVDVIASSCERDPFWTVR